MKSKSIFLMAVSLGFGLVAAIGITQVMGRSKTEATAEVAKQTVLVAVDDLDINTELTPEMFTEEQWPVTMLPEGIVTKFEEIEGKAITARAGKKGFIYLSNLINKDEINLKNIPAGFKLIGISLGAEDHLSGLLQPGDLVDLIAIFRQSNKAAPSSQTFLRQIRVFSIGSSIHMDPENKNAAKGNTVVGLLVTEKQSEQVVLVEKIATLKLALRSKEDPNEDTMVASRGTTWGDDSGSANAAAMLAQMMKRGMSGSRPEETVSQPVQETVTTPAKFTTTVYTSDGPVQYHFDLSTGSTVPVRLEGFSGSTQPAPEASANTPVTDTDLDDRNEESDSDIQVDDLDSEPGS